MFDVWASPECLPFSLIRKRRLRYWAPERTTGTSSLTVSLRSKELMMASALSNPSLRYLVDVIHLIVCFLVHQEASLFILFFCLLCTAIPPSVFQSYFLLLQSMFLKGMGHFDIYFRECPQLKLLSPHFRQKIWRAQSKLLTNEIYKIFFQYDIPRNK